MRAHHHTIGISLLALLLGSYLFCSGCGTSNIFDGAAKTKDYETTLEQAQNYLNEGNFEKAEKYARELLEDKDTANDEEARQILGQALLGRADLTVFDMINALSTHTNPVSGDLTVLNFIPLSKRDLVFEAAAVLFQTEPEENEVVLAKGIAGLSAAVLLINTTFRPDGGNLGQGTGGEPTANAIINATWDTISPNITAWTTAALDALRSSTTDKDLLTAAAAVNTGILFANAQMAIGNVSYANLLSFLGVL